MQMNYVVIHLAKVGNLLYVLVKDVDTLLYKLKTGLCAFAKV